MSLESPHGTAPPPPPSRGAHQPPPGAGVMNVVRWVLFVGLLLVAAASIASYVATTRSKHAAGAATAARYHCPMHPTYTSDKPGECPICGMSLEPIPEPAPGGGPAAGAAVPGLTTVHLAPERIQMIGVRTAVVERRALGTASELVGFVTPDEGRLRRLQIRLTGWVERLHVNRTGETVRAGQPLVTIYSPELLQSEKEFLIETGAAAGASHDTSSASMMMEHELQGPVASRERLRVMGVPESEIRRLARERTPTARLTLPSPASGTVLERSVTDGQNIGPEMALFTIADLSRVWVLADLYQIDLERVAVGDRARFVADALPGRAFEARVEFVYPTLSSDTRTLKARLSLDNRGAPLKPGMYGRATVAGRAASALVVPSEAVVRAGARDYVFLARAGGTFEPRAVELGRAEGERVTIVRGVSAGDTVVASASFLIDSESRLKAAIDGLGAAPSGHVHGGKP